VLAAAAGDEHARRNDDRYLPHNTPRKTDEAGLSGPPRRNSHPNDQDYLTVAGMPLILPAFSSVNCAATAALMEAGTLLLHLP
jgi:hypothetical protein